MIIAFHQYWRSVAGVLISAFGWILALRGVVLMADPGLYERAASAMSSLRLIQLMFGALVVMGLYLTYMDLYGMGHQNIGGIDAQRLTCQCPPSIHMQDNRLQP